MNVRQASGFIMRIFAFIFSFVLGFPSLMASVDHEFFIRAAKELKIPLTKEGNCSYKAKELTKLDVHKNYPEYYTNKKSKSIKDVKTSMHWDCLRLRNNLKRDVHEWRISPEYVFNNLSKQKDQRVTVRNQMKYLGFFSKYYHYDLIQKNGMTIVELRIHFNFDEDMDEFDKKELDMKLLDAERIWNLNAQNFYTKVVFRFKRSDKENAHFSIRYNTKFTRGPYDKRWTKKKSSMYMAHEIGHMLGLDDEYQNIRYTILFYPSFFSEWILSRFQKNRGNRVNLVNNKLGRCEVKSLMCGNDYGETISKSHFYFILGRFFDVKTMD